MRVPEYGGFQAQTSAAPQPQMTAPKLTDTPFTATAPRMEITPQHDIAGAQAGALGQAAANLGQHLSAIGTDMAHEANQYRLADATNQAQVHIQDLTYDPKTGYTSLQGKDALERPDGKPLADEYGAKLKGKLDEIAGTLGNDAQRRAFAQTSANLMAQFHGQALAHEAQQFKVYKQSVTSGTVDTAARQIGLGWSDPAITDESIGRIAAATRIQYAGMDPTFVMAKTIEAVSPAAKLAIESALDNHQPDMAAAYLNRYSQFMGEDDIYTTNLRITKAKDAQAALGAAADVMQSSQPATPLDHLFDALLWSESRKQHFGPDGRPTTSPKGAIGIAQIMPATGPEAARLAGVDWDPELFNRGSTGDPAKDAAAQAYNLKLGRAYFSNQLSQAGGDPAKMLAAYNAGPGSAKKGTGLAGAMRKAADAGQPDAWLNYTPQETQDYVKNTLARAKSAQDSPAARPTLEDHYARLQAHPSVAGSPERLKLAQSEIDGQVSRQTAAIKQREAEGVTAAMRELEQNGGSLAGLSGNAVAGIPAGRMGEIKDYAAKLAKGVPVETDMALYGHLTANPDELAKKSDAEFGALSAKIAKGDLAVLAAKRAKALNPTATAVTNPGELNSPAIKSGLDERLRMLGMDPTPKDDSPDAGRVGAIRQFVDRSMLDAQAQGGKKFTDAEVNAHLDRLFAQNAVTPGGWFSADTSGPMLAQKVSDIPSEARNGIKAAFVKAGVSNPTDGQIITAYWTAMTKRGGR